MDNSHRIQYITSHDFVCLTEKNQQQQKRKKKKKKEKKNEEEENLTFTESEGPLSTSMSVTAHTGR